MPLVVALIVAYLVTTALVAPVVGRFLRRGEEEASSALALADEDPWTAAR